VPFQRSTLLRDLTQQLQRTRREIFRRFPREQAWIEPWLAGTRRLAWVLGGPRCGTSAFKAALASHCEALSLPGEHRCYFTLLGRNFPDHGADSEADDMSALSEAQRADLLEMILTSAFAGTTGPTPSEDEVHRYAWEWALRLPMQWPQLGLTAEQIVGPVARATQAHFAAGGRVPSPEFDVAILRALQAIDARINPRAYDLPAALTEQHFGSAPMLAAAPTPVIVEITPYVVLQPRPLKTPALPASVLLLKASSDPFRIRTMRSLFRGWDTRVLHLTRNPLASINGLLDGWAFPGFWQHDLSGVAGLPRKQRHWKFDLVDGWQSLSQAPLVSLAAAQWRVPNERILRFVAGGVPAARFSFEDFLAGEDTRARMLERAFAGMGLAADAGARRAMKHPPAVNVTHKPRAGRWTARAAELAPVLSDPGIDAIARRLGYDPADHAGWI
jgi:hypothetical protein